MRYVTITLCVSFFILCYLVWRAVSRSNRLHRESKQNFLERESEANSVRKADISTLSYVEIPLAELPVSVLTQNGHPNYADALQRLACKKILNLSMYTNTDLKMMYGPANLDTLSACDEAFTELIQLLQTIADTLVTDGQPDAAEAFLRYAISIGSDLTTSYTLLATLYANRQNTAGLETLLSQAETITSLSGNTIRNKLHSIKSQIK